MQDWRFTGKQIGFVSVALLLALLASCSTTRRDGPPNFYVDESRVKNAVPKPEPLAKYGNMPYYYVNGRRYKVMKTNKHFEQTGIASWYGTMFDSHRTSSGEPYDMLAMTAAHKTLPLPTYVEVTNLKNHRKIIVKVNDRGPFASNRIIDLSYVAAKKLGMLGHGTAPVRIVALDPYTYAEHKTTPAPAKISKTNSTVLTSNDSKLLFLQAGAFHSKSRALNFKNHLAGFNYPVRMIAPTGDSKLYRVQIGPLHDTASIHKVSRRLKTMGIVTHPLQEV